jgi:hypothetical protein
MADFSEFNELLRRPAVIAAVEELGVVSLGIEDVLSALRRFGTVRIDVRDDPALPYVCLAALAGEEPESGRGATVLHAAVACWANVLDSVSDYSRRGLDDLERFVLGENDPA